MIDFELDETLQGVRDMLHWFAESEVRPVALAADRAHAFPDAFLRKVKEMGISMGALSRAEDEQKVRKGPKTVNRVAAIASEELAWGDGAFMLSVPGPGLGGPPVQFLGTPEQKERFFTVFTKDAEARYGAYGLTEPGAGRRSSSSADASPMPRSVTSRSKRRVLRLDVEVTDRRDGALKDARSAIAVRCEGMAGVPR